MEIRMPATNSGFASGGSNVPVRHFFVHLSFVARSEFSAENPAQTQSREALYAMQATFTNIKLMI